WCGVASQVATSLWPSRKSISSAVETCSTWMRARACRARRTSLWVQFSAAISSRQTGCEDGSSSTRSPSRARSRNSSSEWKAARRRVFLRIEATPSSSSTSKLPVEDPMKTLMPAAPGSLSSSPTYAALSRVPPTHKAKSQCMRHAARRAPHRVGERRLAGCQRIGVGHFGYGGDAAECGCARACLEVFLVLHSRLAEMDLAVHHAGQNMQSRTVDPLAGRGLAELSHRGDAAVLYANVAHTLAVVVDHGAACQDEIEGCCHGGPCSL